MSRVSGALERRPSVLYGQRWLRSAVAAFALLVTGCGTPSLPPGGERELLADVKAGRVVLDCGLPCAWAFISKQNNFRSHILWKNWQRLAVDVAKTGWRKDITYFLLGMASQEMGSLEAASRYYRMAGAIADGTNYGDMCKSVKELCLGFDLPRDIYPRLAAVNSALIQRNAAATVAAAATAATTRSEPTVAAMLDFMPDAPQSLLRMYAAERLSSAGKPTDQRRTAFEDALLELLDPTAAASTRGNKLTRPRAIAALKEQLAVNSGDSRLALGMWVQLKGYDPASRGFPLAYPVFGRAGSINLRSGSVFRGGGGRGAGARGYTALGEACVVDPGQQFSQPELPNAYFLLVSACIQHPQPQQRPLTLASANGNEIPPLLQLVLPHGGLWPSLPLDKARAEALDSSVGPWRLVWSELVFDVRALGRVLPGPFDMRDVIDQQRAGLQIAIHPRALVVWDVPPEPEQPGRVLAVLGDAQATSIALTGRLPRAMVADRSYDDLPLPASWTGTRLAPRAPVARPGTVPPQPTAPTAPARPNDEWIEPPPARR